MEDASGPTLEGQAVQRRDVFALDEWHPVLAVADESGGAVLHRALEVVRRESALAAVHPAGADDDGGHRLRVGVQHQALVGRPPEVEDGVRRGSVLVGWPRSGRPKDETP